MTQTSSSLFARFLLAISAMFVAEQACSQTVNAGPDETVEVSRQQLEAIQQELQYLRQRDAQREAADQEILERLSGKEGWLTSQCAWGPDVECGNMTCGSCLEGANCCGVCGEGCGCSGCYACLCPTPEAPCIDCPRATTLNPYFNVRVFGTLTADMLFNESRPIAPGTPYFLAPAAVLGRHENTFDLHARQSTLGAALTGPQWGNWQTGGQVLGVFYNDNVLADKYGFLPMLAYGEMRNDNWRLAAGLQFDVFNPMLPTMLPFSALSASGNSGNAFRGQLRAERFIQPSSDVQWTLQAALSEPIPTTIDPSFRISEDNGWPNVEGRVALSLGALQGVGPTAARPFELGVSGIVGQVRTTPAPPDAQVVSDVWGIGTDFRWRMNSFLGVAAELYSGQGLGTYNGAILQTVNTDTFDTVRSTGGWVEGYVYLTPCVHSHLGYGVDDPQDNDVSNDPTEAGRVRNETYFANLLWDVNQTLRVGFEFTWRDTAYQVLRDNQGAGYQAQFRWAF